jgi:hypothetical protein
VRETLAGALRGAANRLSPPPPPPRPKAAITVTRSRRKVIDGIEMTFETLDHDELAPPLRNSTMGVNDELDLSHDVNGWTQEGLTCVVSHTFHVTWEQVTS